METPGSLAPLNIKVAPPPPPFSGAEPLKKKMKRDEEAGANSPSDSMQMAQPEDTGPETRRQMDAFWKEQLLEVELGDDPKFDSLPIARIKKIMRSDEDVHVSR
jgi:hypothetical protein